MTIAELARLVKRGFDKTASKADLVALRGELKGEIGGVRSELTREIGGVRAELKADLKGLEGRVTHQLDGIAKGIRDLKEENAAHQAAHQRFERRDRVFAEKLQVNLDQVDAEV
jgi:hypothetical protein